MTGTLYQVSQGGTDSAADINQIVQALTGITLVSPGPLVQLATQTIVATTGSLTFANIPAYNNIIISWQARSDAAANTDTLGLRVNGDVGANYQYNFVQGQNTTASAGVSVAQTVMGIGAIAAASATSTSMTGGGFAVITGWAQKNNRLMVTSTASSVWGTSAGTQAVQSFAGIYNTTGTTFSSILLTPFAGNFAGTVAPCTFTIYGSM